MVAHLSLKLKAVLETESLNFFISDHDRGHINKLLTGHRTAAEHESLLFIKDSHDAALADNTPPVASYFSKEDHSAETPVNFFPEGVFTALALRYPGLAEYHRGLFKRVALTGRGGACTKLGDETARERIEAVLIAAKEEHLNDNSHKTKHGPRGGQSVPVSEGGVARS